LSNPKLKYPLLPYSQLVYDSTRRMPMVYRFPMTFIWRGGAKEKDRIEHAIRTALANHPVFQMAVDWRGRHYPSSLKDILHGRYHDIELSTQGEDVRITTQFSRILGDGRSVQILIEDIQRAYAGLPLVSDDYWAYVERYEQQKSNAHYHISHDWLINEFADNSVPVRPTIDRPCIFTVLPPKAGLYYDDYTSLRKKILQLKENEYLTLDGFFSLCAALAIAEYCGTEEAALTWAYEGRETPEEQRVFGSLHRDIPFQINHKSKIINNKSDLIRLARNQIRQGIAHSDYPYTLTYPYTKRWNYAVNVLNTTDLEDFLPTVDIPLVLESEPEQKYAYALWDIEILERTDNFRLRYRYSATHYKESSIRRFASLVRKYVEWLLEK
jgi:hypothetical protein